MIRKLALSFVRPAVVPPLYSIQCLPRRQLIGICCFFASFIAYPLLTFCQDHPGNQDTDASGAGKGAITFVQITDTHLFDDGKRSPTADEASRQQQDDWNALEWAIQQINQLVKSGRDIDFVVFTGDLGLELVRREDENPCSAQDREAVENIRKQGWPALLTPSQAAAKIANQLSKLEVKTIYFIPGNNDLACESPADLARYRDFINQTAGVIRSRYPRLIDLAGIPSGEQYGTFRLVGLNSASFKTPSNYKNTCEQDQKPGCPAFEFERLNTALSSQKPGTLFLIFTHVPDLLDPGVPLDPASAECEFSPPPNADAWRDLAGLERAKWDATVQNEKVAGIFAGHLHACNRAFYAMPGSETILARADRVTIAKKTWVAPPLAIKFQEDKKITARGLLLVQVRKQSNGVGAVTVVPFWYAAPVYQAHKSQWLTWIGIGFMWIVVGFAAIAILSAPVWLLPKTEASSGRLIFVAVLILVWTVGSPWLVAAYDGVLSDLGIQEKVKSLQADYHWLENDRKALLHQCEDSLFMKGQGNEKVCSDALNARKALSEEMAATKVRITPFYINNTTWIFLVTYLSLSIVLLCLAPKQAHLRIVRTYLYGVICYLPMLIWSLHRALYPTDPNRTLLSYVNWDISKCSFVLQELRMLGLFILLSMIWNLWWEWAQAEIQRGLDPVATVDVLLQETQRVQRAFLDWQLASVGIGLALLPWTYGYWLNIIGFGDARGDSRYIVSALTQHLIWAITWFIVTIRYWKVEQRWSYLRDRVIAEDAGRRGWASSLKPVGNLELITTAVIGVVSFFAPIFRAAFLR